MFAFVSSRSNQGQPILNLPLSHSPYLPPKLRSKVFPRISALPRVSAHPLEPTYQTGAEIALYEIFLESQKFWTKRNHHLISYLSLNPPSPPPHLPTPDSYLFVSALSMALPLARLVCFSCLAGWKGDGNDRPLTCFPRPQFPRWLSTLVILLYCTYIIHRLCVVLYANMQLGGDLPNHYLGTQNDGTRWAPAASLQIITSK